MNWNPKEMWKGNDVFIIGGGTSLRDFNWSLLRNKATIGCNYAFSHGVNITKICHFCDYDFWLKFHKELEDYKGLVVTTHPNFTVESKQYPEWLKTMRRQPEGLAFDGLGFNGNTGASAINLAFLLGAKRVYLLGFDMALSDEGKANWHTNSCFAPNPNVYKRFYKGFDCVLRDWKIKFPDREIINLNDKSGLDQFPKVNRDTFFKELV